MKEKLHYQSPKAEFLLLLKSVNLGTSGSGVGANHGDLDDSGYWE